MEYSKEQAELQSRLRFETLIADLSLKFVNLPVAEVDREIEDALRQVCELLSIDLAVLWQWFGADPGVVIPTHAYCSKQELRPSEPMSEDQYPWSVEQVRAGRVFAISTLDDLPAEAAVDRETCQQFGIKAAACLPLSVGGESPIGALGLNALLVERDWPELLLKRLQVVANIFANAVARKYNDQALRESEARLEAGTELAGLGHYEVDYGAGTCFIDDRFRNICGIPQSAQEGLEPLEFWMQHVHPDDLPVVLNMREELHEGKLERVSAEYRYEHPEQGQKWIHHLARMVNHGSTGVGVQTFGVVRDITAEKRMELDAQELRNNLTHLARVNTLGALSGSLAHELNQPLGVILSNAQAAQELLAQDPPDLAEVQEILTDIVSADHRAGEVIKRLRALLKHGRVSLQSLQLNDIFDEVLLLTRADLIGRGVTLTCDLAPDLPPVAGDRVQLQQLVMNLLLNAADAMADNASGTRRLQLLTKLEQGQVRGSVRDEGGGLPADIECLFQPFYTTKPQGLGLGLAICWSIVAGHHGRLWAERHPECGAVFNFELPVAEASDRS